MLAKSGWIYFYLWIFRGKPIYVGQSRDVQKRNHRRFVKKDGIGKFLHKYRGECVLKDLNLKVWDIPQGRWAIRIENALMDLYDTLKPKGLNLCYATGKGHLDSARLGNASLTREIRIRGGRKGGTITHKLHPNLRYENGLRFATYGHLGPSAQPKEAKVKGGKIIGRINVESGHFASLKTPEHQSKAGKKGGTKSGFKNCHARWHVKRNITNPNCTLCKGEN